jgi:hypothetical protein
MLDPVAKAARGKSNAMGVARRSHVMVVYHNPLFAHSIRAALAAWPEVVLVAEFDDWARAEVEIARLEPDVVVLEETGDDSADRALRALRSRESPWRLVAMRLDETDMRVWSGAWQPVTSTRDLIDALTGGAPPLPGRFEPATSTGATNGED